jgi:excisionase family DNA binding protein
VKPEPRRPLTAGAENPRQDGGPGPSRAEYLTPAEVGVLLKVSRMTVYRWAQEDPSMPVLRIAGTMRFPRARLERWLRCHFPKPFPQGILETFPPPRRAGGRSLLTAS